MVGPLTCQLHPMKLFAMQIKFSDVSCRYFITTGLQEPSTIITSKHHNKWVYPSITLTLEGGGRVKQMLTFANKGGGGSVKC